jgi:hypothetical protein
MRSDTVRVISLEEKDPPGSWVLTPLAIAYWVKTRRRTEREAMFVRIGAVILLQSAVVMAGPLTPPAGPIAATMKTISEVEPRTAINAVNTPGDANSLYKITQPGLVLPDRQHHRRCGQARRRDRGQRRDAGPQRL